MPGTAPFSFAASSVASETETCPDTVSFTEEEITEPVSSAPATTAEPQTGETHVHSYRLVSRTEATCSAEGREESVCACGDVSVRVIPRLAHRFTPATCTAGEVCQVCGAAGSPALGHLFEGDHCSRCGEVFVNDLYVLGKGLDFDESPASVFTKLGPPSETLREGNLASHVYASDYRRFTVVPTDEEGLWGVFTLDPLAFCLLGGTAYRLSDFSAPVGPDDCREISLSGTLVTAFCDFLSGGANWSIWFHLAEVPYHYAYDGAVSQNYAAQEKLCYYLTNALRVKNGLSALIWSPQASAVAREYAACMVREGFFDHDDSYKTRLTEAGINWHWIGENISEGYENAYAVVSAYYNSPPHRENLLNRNFTHLGTGFVLSVGEEFIVYGAQEFYSLR